MRPLSNGQGCRQNRGMKTSALIEQLQRMLAEHGDLHCCIELVMSEGESPHQHAPVRRIEHVAERPVVGWGHLSGRNVIALK
jgi:hypothetical protein